MQKILLVISAFILSTLFQSFIGCDNTPPPGKIEVVSGENIFTFNKWSFTTFEVPNANIELINAIAEINTTSLTCDWKDLQNNIRKKKDYFYVKKFPTATVTIKGATKLENGSYSTEAVLTLKKYTEPVNLTFNVINDNPLTIQGAGEMNRRSWGFTGDGPDDIVPISFTFTQPAE